MKKKNIFFVEITDLFGGELNYSWVRRYLVNANTIQGAIAKIGREYGRGFRLEYGDSESGVYKNYNIGAFVAFVDDVEVYAHYSHITEI